MDIDPDVLAYLDGLPDEQRALFDRVHRIVLDVCPEARVVIAYKMPTYRRGARRLHVGAWQHGVSLYGWKATGDGGFTARHPQTLAGSGTIRLRTDAAAEIPDEDLRALVRATLAEK